MKNSQSYKKINEAQEINWLEDHILLLAKKYKEQPIEIAQELVEETKITTSASQTKNIGIFYPRFYDGGVERVISLQIPLFLRLGFTVVLITEEIRPELEYSLPIGVKRRTIPKHLDQGRVRELSLVLREENIDTVIHHASTSLNLIWDLLVTQLLRKKAIVCRHEIICTSLLQGTKPKRLMKLILEPLIYRLSNMLVVLGKMEEDYFRALEVKAKFIPNPRTFEFKKNPHSLKQSRKKVVWIGRLDQSTKNFKAALEIMALLAKQEDKVECHLVGPESDLTSRRYVEDFIVSKGLSGRIIWDGRCKNIGNLLQTASVHLLTSYVESFSMSILESKSYGVPLVLFDLSYLDLLKDGKGFISIPQGKIKECAEAILKIIRNPELEGKLSDEAFESVNSFYKNAELEKLWKNILLGTNQEDFSPKSQEFSNFVRLQNSVLKVGLSKETSNFSIKKIKSSLLKKISRIRKKISNCLQE